MLTTIRLGSCISVQGDLVAQLPTGEFLVRDGSKLYRGRPVPARSETRPAAPVTGNAA
jgi:hypothetical protein